MQSQGNPNALKHLHDIYKRIYCGKYGRRKCWDILVEIIADHEGMIVSDYDDYSCDTDIENMIMKYKIAAEMDPWDYLGELFELEGFGSQRSGQFFTPRNVITMMVQMNLSGMKFDKVQTVLDPCLGTGRMLLVASNLFPDAPLILFGVDIDLSLYRASIVNMKMFSKHPFGIACADSLKLESSSPASPMWDQCSYWTGSSQQYKWTPEDMTPFYFKPSQIIPSKVKKSPKKIDKIDESQMALSIVESQY